jgi:hypothetical protein
MTFSMLARRAGRGTFGGAVASSGPALAARRANASAGLGDAAGHRVPGGR